MWDDGEFSQNQLELECKNAVRHRVEQYAPTAKPFFTDVLKLQNADIHELLAELALMQEISATIQSEYIDSMRELKAAIVSVRN